MDVVSSTPAPGGAAGTDPVTFLYGALCFDGVQVGIVGSPAANKPDLVTHAATVVGVYRAVEDSVDRCASSAGNVPGVVTWAGGLDDNASDDKGK